MRVLRNRDYRRMPWKNGGGETMEIAVQPPDASLAAFGWRISLARVDRSGPFSRFPGIDRTLSIVQGEGLELAVEGYSPVMLGRDSEPFKFPGDTATIATLVRGPVMDLNVMTRRGLHRHTMERHRDVGPWELRLRAAITGIVVADGIVEINCAGQNATLNALDSALIAQSSVMASLSTTRPAEIVLIEID
ncbi:MAG: HutD/Ves family protein [Steroidobacterales bacterium]